jgi:phage terminase small subunit
MTPRQQRFVEEYLTDANGHQAALRAGYKPRSARQTVTELLKRPEVAEAIRQGMAARAERTRITADRVLQEIARIAFADIGRLADWGPDGLTLAPKSAISEDDRAAIAELGAGSAGPRLRLHNKQRALENIARHLGLFGRTAARFAPRPADEKPAREILREKLEQMARAEAAEEAEAPPTGAAPVPRR